MRQQLSFREQFWRGNAVLTLIAAQQRIDLTFSEALYQPLSSWVSEVLAGCRTEGQRKDAHVIALAITTKASPIITDSRRDFLRKLLDSWGTPQSLRTHSVWT